MVGAYATLALTGSCGNALMLLALIRDGPLRDAFGRILRILLIVHSCVDLVYSLVGLPLYTLSIMYAEWALWQQNTVICHSVVVSVWLLSSTSKWYLLVLALTRLIATAWPLYFRAVVRHSNTWMAVFIIMAPVCGSIVYTVSTLVGWAEMTWSRGENWPEFVSKSVCGARHIRQIVSLIHTHFFSSLYKIEKKKYLN